MKSQTNDTTLKKLPIFATGFVSKYLQLHSPSIAFEETAYYTNTRLQEDINFFASVKKSQGKPFDEKKLDQLRKDIGRNAFIIREYNQSTREIEETKIKTAGLLGRILEEKLPNSQLLSELKKEYNKDILLANSITSLTTDEMHVLLIASTCIGENGKTYQQGGVLRGTEFIKSYAGIELGKPASFQESYPILTKKPNGEITIAQKLTSFESKEKESYIQLTLEIEHVLIKQNQGYWLKPIVEKTNTFCTPLTEESLHETLLEKFNDEVKPLTSLSSDNDKNLLAILSVVPMLSDPTCKNEFISWYSSLPASDQRKIDCLIKEVCSPEFAKEYLAEAILSAALHAKNLESSSKALAEVPVLKKTFHQTYNVYDANGKKRSFANYFLGFPDPLPEKASVHLKRLKFIASLFVAVALPITILIKLLKGVLEAPLKLIELTCEQSNHAGIRMIGHGCGMLSSLVRYLISFNPVQAIRECSAATARPSQLFGPRAGKIIGGLLGGLLSSIGMAAAVLFAPAMILSMGGIIGGHMATAILVKELTLTSIHTALIHTTGGAIIGSGVAATAIAKTTTQIYQELNTKPSPAEPIRTHSQEEKPSQRIPHREEKTHNIAAIKEEKEIKSEPLSYQPHL